MPESTNHEARTVERDADALLAVSPEDSHVWHCPACGNRERFTGVDERGCGGPDECDGSCGFDPDSDAPDAKDFCECETELTQDFTVRAQDGTAEGEDIDYQAFVGGGDDAEIGTYTRIYCGECDALLWRDVAPET